MAKLLIVYGASISAQDSRGCTALIGAARKRNIELVRLFVKKGADINASNNEGRTALMEAAGDYLYSSRNEIVSFLIDNGADISIKDKDGKTAADLAEKQGNKEIAELMRKKKH